MKSKGYWRDLLDFMAYSFETARKRRIFFCFTLKVLKSKFIQMLSRYFIGFGIAIACIALFSLLIFDNTSKLINIMDHEIKYTIDTTEKDTAKQKRISPADYSATYSALASFASTVLILITIGFSLYTLLQQIDQRKNDQNNRKSDIDRSDFFNALANLDSILSRIDIDDENGDVAFLKWYKKFEDKFYEHIFETIQYKRETLILNDLEASKILEIFESYGISHDSKYFEFMHCEDLAEKANSYLNVQTDGEYKDTINRYPTIKRIALKYHCEQISQDALRELIEISAAESFESIEFRLGPFFKMINRMIEISNRDKSGALRNILKAQLTSHQMIAIQANCIVGLCDKMHYEMIVNFKLTTHATWIRSQLSGHLNQYFIDKLIHAT